MRAALIAAILALAAAACGNEAETIDLTSTADAGSSMSMIGPDTSTNSCTCMQPEHIGNTCDCESWKWGCVNAPQESSRYCHLPPPCWVRSIDPQTGCEKVEPNANCGLFCSRSDAG
jgi:hypothetical protein